MTLIVLAAAMGSRYGGLKQLEGIGPSGETILDYSIYDAIHAGFHRIIFVINRNIEREFKHLVSGKYEHLVDIAYVFQDLEDIPLEKRNPNRKFPYGSVRAVLTCKNLVNEPFGVINAVNFYQRESFTLLNQALVALKSSSDYGVNICFRLKNVLSETVGVKRGICEVDEQGYLQRVTDCENVELVSGKPMYPNTLHRWIPLEDDDFVSMNMWGFRPEMMADMQQEFDAFLEKYGQDLKAHFPIPEFVNQRIHKGDKIKVIETPARWMGLVSQDDKIQVVLRINEMIRKGVYPSKLF